MARRRFMPFALAAILAVYSLSFLVYALVKTRTLQAANSALPKLASLSETSSLRTARNNLTLNLGDGREVISAFAGPPELRAALEQNQAHPLSLAAADFDEDGVPDLITGYEVSGRGAFSLMRGNVDSIYPNEPEARQRLASGRVTHAPFLSPAFLFESPTAVDFVGAGDFDGDSHWDVVVASRSSDSLYLFSGNGKGGFAPARETKLPGVATAFVTGEINRSDGLTDIVVSINGPDGPSVLVFEGPEGALRSVPEHISLARPASALALAQLTDSYEIDLAVAAGHELQIVRGRDRKLSLDKQQQAEVLPLATRSRFFSQTIKAISAGDFSTSGNSDLAVLFDDGELQLLVNPDTVAVDKSSRTTNVITRWQSLPSSKHWPGATSLTRVRVSGQAGDDLAITDSDTKELEIWNGAENKKTGLQPSEAVVLSELLHDQTGIPLTVLPMRLNADALSDLVVVSNDKTTTTVVLSHSNDSQIRLTSSSTPILSAATAGPWTSTGDLTVARNRHSATVLSNGKVLVAGGSNSSGVTAAAELYDPSTGIWSTTSSLATPRERSTATRLLNGKVLVVGGTNNNARIAAAELYDPSTNSWSSAGSLAIARVGHTATLLTNGKVLVAGGYDNSFDPVFSGELYDPSTNTWSAAGNPSVGRGDSVAILLQNGKVLISGGYNSGYLASSEIYDPLTNTWTSAGNLNVARAQHAGVLLPSGRVLVVGGNSAIGSLASAELYDPSLNSWSTVGSLSTERLLHSMTLLGDGKVLIAGGFGGAPFAYLASSETYDSLTATWSNGGNMASARGYHAAVILQNGKVLVCGGYNSGYLASAELYDPAVPVPTPVPPKTFVVNSAADTDNGVCNVGKCTLREAINAANANPGADTITFHIGTGVQTISPLSPLPTITEAVTLDATTQPGFAGRPIIELNGSLAGPANGLSIKAPNTVVRGFVINRFSGSSLTGNGIGVLNVGNALIEGNYIGINVNGDAVLPNGGSGVRLEGGPSNKNRIGGSVPAARNVISGNGSGITAADGNGRIDQNVISGNYIGTSASGTIALGNADSGVSFYDSVSLNTIGGTSAGTSNVISGNRVNIDLRPVGLPFQGVLIQGNFIGTDVNGTLPLGGMGGVTISANFTFQLLAGTTVGGTIASARNIISGNQGSGIGVAFEEVTGTQIQGNYIGTDVTGTSALGNGTGVLFELGPKYNTIGGSVNGARNIISGNTNSGASISMQFGSVNSVEGNFIGTDFTGTAKLGNGGNGVSVFLNSLGEANAVIVDNVISNNGQNGLNLSIFPCLSCTPISQGISISNNHIGTDVTNTLDMGNGLDGILLNARASSNKITQNAIAFNRGNGVNIPGTDPNASVNNLIEFNSIFANSALGINLGDLGVTENDLKDLDNGGNTLQNFPVLTSINALPAESGVRAMSESADNPTPVGSTITVSGTLNSSPNSTFVIQWIFTADTQCETERPQPQTPPLSFGKVPNVLTDANGDASYNFDFDFPPGINAGLIYANATNSTNNTSEYSGCFPIRATVPVTIETNPVGRSFSVDGGPLVSSTQVLNWLPGSTHAIATTSIQAGTTGQQFVWNNWSDSGSLSHSVTVPNSGTTYTANFTTQYLLTMNAGSGGSTSPPNGFFNSGQIVQISAVPSNGFSFTGWTGSGSGSFSGSANPASVTMNGPITETAAFSQTVVQTPLGQNVSVTLNRVTVSFASVTAAGATTINPINPNAAGQLPNSYQLTGNNTAFEISTTAVVQPPITVCFNLPSVTEATTFGQLRILHKENGSLMERTASQNFASKMICASVNSLSPFVLASTTTPLWQLLLEESGAAHQVVALDSVLLVRDPFPVINPWNLFAALDRNTRVLVFVRNLELTANETAAAVTVNLVGSNNQSYDIAAESVQVRENVDFSHISFRLPDTLVPGACTIQVRAHGQVSNSGFIQIRP